MQEAMNCDNVLPEVVNPPSKKTSREIRHPRHNKSDDTIVRYEEEAKKESEQGQIIADPLEEEQEEVDELPPYASPSPILARTSYMNRLLKAPVDPLTHVEEVIEEEEDSPEKGKA